MSFSRNTTPWDSDQHGVIYSDSVSDDEYVEFRDSDNNSVFPVMYRRTQHTLFSRQSHWRRKNKLAAP